MTAQVIALPVLVQPARPLERFVSEEARQAYFAGYADALTDATGPDAAFLFATDAALRAELVRRGLHLTVAS